MTWDWAAIWRNGQTDLFVVAISFNPPDGRGGADERAARRPSVHLPWVLLLGLLLALVSQVGCRSREDQNGKGRVVQDSPPLFEEIQDEVGLLFVHDPGKPGTWYYPEMMIAGAALLDYDRDGDLDIYLINCGASPIGEEPPGGERAANQLFRQEAGGRFTNVTSDSGLGDQGYGCGVAVGDINNDGWPDVYVTNVGNDRLYLNDGAGHFRDISSEAGIASDQWSAAACFVDFDRDGWLDIYVSNYVDYHTSRECYATSGRRDYCGPSAFRPTADQLYRNLGGVAEQGGAVTPRFENVAVSAGIADKPGPGLGVVALDFNDDGWQDLYVANDGQANRLWINRQDGTFRDEALMRGAATDSQGRPQASMGIGFGDLNNDRMPDLFVAHMAGEMNVMYSSTGTTGFREVGMQQGLAAIGVPTTTFGTALLDIELDGDEDIVASNGRMALAAMAAEVKVDEGAEVYWSLFYEPNHIFLNDGQAGFASVANRQEKFTQRNELSRGLCVGDVDNDGDLDMLLVNTAGPARLYRNVAKRAGNWLRVEALEPSFGGRDAYGARITVTAGERQWVRWVSPGSSYLCSMDPIAHFGLGNVEQITHIEVRWPDGSCEVFKGGGVNQKRVLRHGEGVAP